MLALEPLVREYGIAGLFADIFLESLGLPLPGETVLAVASGLAGAGVLNIYAVGLAAFFAAVTGDNLGYLIGRRLGRPVVVRNGARIGITHDRLRRVEALLDSKGMFIVSVARFFPLLRQLNGIAAGTAGMPWLRFLIANIVGAALWVGIWTTLAFRFGQNADLLPVIWHWFSRFAFLTVPALILILLAGWLWTRRGSGLFPPR